MQTDDLDFIHQFVPASDPPSDVTLLLLHGTGGNENDLLPLGRAILPDADLLSPRGKVLENGMPRFFRRFAEGVFDVEDLKACTDELARFIEAAVARYKLKANSKLVADQLGHTLDVNQNVYTQSPIESRLVIVNQLESLLVQ